MSVDYMVSQIYADIITRVTSTEDDWKAVCRLMGQIYRYDFDNVLLVYAQKPSATLVADYDTWKKVNRYVKRGSKGIAIFPTPLLRSNVRHVFDISDTGGRKQKLTWNLEGDNLSDYLGLLKSEGEIEGEIATDREGQLNQLKAFTKREIGVIIKEDFGKRLTEIVMLAGHVLTGEKNKTPELAAQMLVENSVFYAVGTRCGFDLSSEELDLGSIVDVADESHISVLGSLVCDVSCTVLRTFNRNITKLENERRMKYGSISNQLPRGNGRSAVSEHQHGGAGESDIRQIRDNGNGVSESRASAEIPQFAEVQSAEPEVERSGGGGESVDGETGKAVSSEEQTTQSGVHDGEISNPHAGKDAGGGDSKTSGREQISLEVEQELNKELEELNSIGVSSDSTKGDATYQQASLFDYMDMPKSTAESFMDKLNREIAETEAQGQYHFMNPKKETDIPHDYIVEALLHGSGFEGGKKRIIAMYQDIPDKKERVKAIKKEYGQGGAGWPLEGYGLHGYDSFHGKGLRLCWKDEEGEKEGYLSWNTIEAEIGALVLSGEYLQRLDKAEEVIEGTVEIVDENGVVSKADMFTKQTIRAKQEIERVETAVEALNISINELNEVNIPFMLSIYEPNAPKEQQRQKLIEELKGIIFLNPQRYLEHDKNYGWETADEYLSGNVRDKLRVAKASANEHPELFGDNVAALEQVQPQDLDASEIEVRIGTTWIEPEDYEQFLYETLNTPASAQAIRNRDYSRGIQVQLLLLYPSCLCGRLQSRSNGI